MEKPNPTYLLEHMGPELRVTVTHEFNENERVTFTVLVRNTPEVLPNLHSTAFGKFRELLSFLP